MTKRPAWPPPNAAKQRGYRLAILGPATARCENCAADCTTSIGEWAVDGLCRDCARAAQQKVAGH